MAKKKRLQATDGVLIISPPGRQIDSKVSDDVITRYTNSANVEVSTWDVKLRFGLIASTTPELITINETVHIYMSHEHAKAFHNALTKSLQQLESLKTQVAQVESAQKPS